MREFSFRKTFGGSHEDFLNEPVITSQWLNAIAGIIGDLRPST